MRPPLIRLGCWLLASLALQAHALQIVSVTPQGEVARVRQVVAKLDDSAVNFGDPKAPAPLTLNCTDALAGKGSGRWLNDRTWVFDFERDLPPAWPARCNAWRGSNPPKAQI